MPISPLKISACLKYFLQFIYDSEKKAAENDIFFEIKKGVKLRHVKTNDRSKPMLSGKLSSKISSLSNEWVF